MTEYAESTQCVSGGAPDGAHDAGVAILGFGTAAMNALIGLRNAGYAGAVRVFTDGGQLPYSPILTSYYAGGMKEHAQCFPWTQAEVDELGAEILSDCTVERLDVTAHVVHTSRGAFPYAKCVIATGARPMAYGFPPVTGGEYAPLMLRTMDDAERLRAALMAPRCSRILVSGASMVALKTLEAALERGVRVTLVGMNPHVLDMNAEPEAAERIEARLRDFGVELRLGQTIQAVERVCGADEADWHLKVTFSNGEVDEFDEISVSHGMRSNLEFLEHGALEIDRALLVDEFMRTSDPDVYAAGDVAQALELLSGEQRVVGIWKTAALQGFCAGSAIAAELAGSAPAARDAYKGAMATNTIVVRDCVFISAGISQARDGMRAETEVGDDMTVVRIWEPCEADGADERLVGFNIACDHEEAGSRAYDLGAMLTMRIEQGCRR